MRIIILITDQKHPFKHWKINQIGRGRTEQLKGHSFSHFFDIYLINIYIASFTVETWHYIMKDLHWSNCGWNKSRGWSNRGGRENASWRADQIQNPRHFLIRIYPVLDDGSKFSQTVPFFIDIDSWYYLITSQPPLNHLLHPECCKSGWNHVNYTAMCHQLQPCLTTKIQK